MSNRRDTLDFEDGSDAGPVECLGQSFESEAIRRKHYLELLREKLKDPDFRDQPGFPIGADDDILALSDPPYYTACPNPWIEEFVNYYGKPINQKQRYHRDPFVSDIEEGKTHGIYKAHPYHTKVPHRAIMRYILHYSEPGDLVFDGFCGSGMTGVAAQMCGNKDEIGELGLICKADGRIVDSSGNTVSKLGARKSIIGELSPAATLIAKNYCSGVHSASFENAAVNLMEKADQEIGWMYETKKKTEKVKFDYTVWSEVFSCPECGAAVIFLDCALDLETKRVQDEFPCGDCGAVLTKGKCERVFDTKIDPSTNSTFKRVKFVPVLIQYREGRTKREKRPDSEDLGLLSQIEQLPFPSSAPINEWPIERMYHGSRLAPKGITKSHHLYLDREIQALSFLWGQAKVETNPSVRSFLFFMLEQAFTGMSLLNRYKPLQHGRPGGSQVGLVLNGVYYVPSQHSECSPWYNFEGKIKRLTRTFAIYQPSKSNSIIFTGTASDPLIPDETIDYIFTDPPFGENIPYADLNIPYESWRRVFTNSEFEAIVDTAKGKGINEYKLLMLECFMKFFRILKPGRWITVEFSNSKASIWNAIQTTLQEAGFVVANVSALDKQQKSFRSVTTTTAVKQDLVISAYKPNGQLELNFSRNAGSAQGVWDFIEYHLQKLPVVKVSNAQLEPIAERDPRILFDRTVAFFVSHEMAVPISSAEFQKELDNRYAKREGLIYLTDQLPEYDAVHAKTKLIGQMTIFVEDEKSAIDWLRHFLKRRPSTYQDIQPEFMKQLSASWKKWESRPELSFLLDQAFLQYKGDGPVPSQIHNYLSTQFKTMRKLEKTSPLLKAKAMDRWYVPDPSKQADVDEMREKSLLQEFWGYLPTNYTPPALSSSFGGDNLPGLKFDIPKVPKGKKLKELRAEAVRAGFRFCHQKKDYQTILVAAQVVPDDVIEEDEQLLLIFDMAVTRSGSDD